MKKFILALMAIIAFAAASPGSASAAEVKLKTSLNSWSNGNEFTMTETEAGIYSCDMPKNKSDLEYVIVYNGSEYKASSQSEQTKTINADGDYTAAVFVSGTNGSNFKTSTGDNYKIYFRESDKAIKVVDANETEETPGDTKYYASIKSKAFGGDWPETDFEMTEKDGAYYYVFNNTSDAFNLRIKIATGTSNTYLKPTDKGADGLYATAPSTESGDNLYMASSKSYKITYYPTSKKVGIEEYTGDITDPDDPTPLTGTFSVKTSQNGWNDNSSMSNDGNVWTCYGKDFTAGDQFVIVNTATNPATEYKSEFEDKNGTKIELNTPTKAVINGNDHNYKIETTGKYDVIFDARDKNNLTVTIKLKNDGDDEDEVWSTKNFVYFNAGFDWERDSKIDRRTLYAHFIKKGSNEPVAGKYRVQMSDNRDKEDNVNALLPLFYAPVPENYNDFWGVQFEVEDGSLVYNSTKPQEASKYDWENGNWFKFIYGCEKSVAGNTDGSVCRAEQSYVTYEQYKARRDDPNKEAIYYLGNNLKGRDGLNDSSEWFDLSFDGKMGTSQRSEDVFMFQVTPQNRDEEVKFKMSWIAATDRMNEYNSGTGRYKDIKNGANENVAGCDQRWWATFNLGLVGPTLAPKYNGDLKAAQEAGDYKKTEDVNDNGAISYIPGRCLKYSRYNMYDWWIKAGQVSNGTYYVVIDTYYKTTALVPFKPAPSINALEMSTPAAYAETIDDEHALQFGDKLKGREAHGATKINKANTVTGTAIINTSEGISFWADENNDGTPDYHLDYGLYYAETANPLETTEASEDNLLTTFRGIEAAKSYSAEVRNLPVGTSDAVKVGVRCTYTDNTNSSEGYEAKFRSFTDWKISNPQNFPLPEPSLAVEKNIAYRLDGKKWHAHVTGTLNATDEHGLNYFFDVDDEQPSGHGVHLAESSEFQCQNGIAKAHYTGIDQNWATVKDDKSVNFVIENIVMADTLPAKESYESRFYLQFPFITGDLNPEVYWCSETDGNGTGDKLEQAQLARRRASAYAAPRTDMVFLSIPVTATTNVGESLSGIADADVEAGAPAEYFNMQGVRVEGEITPGVYIVRRGSKVTKEIVR